MKTFPLLLAAWLPIAVNADPQPSIIGTWELVYVAPIDVMNSDPRGVTNTKLHFTADGKVVGVPPDRALTPELPRLDYQIDGKGLTLARDGKRLSILTVSFPDPETLVLSPPHGAQRQLRKIAGPDVLLEPRSLELLRVADGSATQVVYDSRDYSNLKTRERMQGVWEIISYTKVPPNQIPPYGFFNDIWTIAADKVTVARRDPPATIIHPYAIAADTVALGPAVLGDPGPGPGVEWKIMFDRWGHLVLDRPEARITFKLVSKQLAGVPAVPLKVVLLGVAGD